MALRMDPMNHACGPAARAAIAVNGREAAGTACPSLGELLIERRLLERADVGRVLAQQQRSGQRFGEAVVALAGR